MSMGMSIRNSSIDEMIQAELKSKSVLKSFNLTAEKELNQRHEYWHQAQGEMAAACVSWANFVVLTNVDFRIFQVERTFMGKHFYAIIVRFLS